MEQKEKTEKIKQKLSEVLTLVRADMSLIEKDIAKQKLREVYEELSLMGVADVYTSRIEIQNQEEDDNLPEIEVKIITGDDAPSGEIIIEDIPARQKEKTFVEPKPEIVVEQSVEVKKEDEETFDFEDEPEVKEIKVEAKEPVIHEKHPEKTVKEKPSSRTVADQFETKKSLNDHAAINNRVKDLASKMKDQPIKDLKEAINLNERFLFTKELFGGNAENYGKTIDDLNRAKDLDEAMDYLNKNFSWDMEKDSFKKFLELVYRRHIPVK